MRQLPILAGSTSGKGGSGSARSPVETPDSLQSKAYARFVDLISEGTFAGLCNTNGIVCNNCSLLYQPEIVNGAITFPADKFVEDADHVVYRYKRGDGSLEELVTPSSGYPMKLPDPQVTEPILAIIEGDGTEAEIHVIINDPANDSFGSVYGLKVIKAGKDYTAEKTKISIPPSIGQGIYFDDVPIQNQKTLKFNFKDVRIEYRLGTETQLPMAGFDFVEEIVENSDHIPLLQGEEFTLRMENKQYDRALVDIIIPNGFYKQDPTNGDVLGIQGDDTVILQIIQKYKSDTAGGGYIREAPFGAGTYYFRGKTMSAYVRTLEGSLTKDDQSATHSWELTFRRITKNDAQFENPNYRHTDIGIARIIGITDVKMMYPFCVLVGIEINAEQFNHIPVRSYDFRMMLLQVPSNYFAPGSRRPNGTIRTLAEYNRLDGAAIFDSAGLPVDQPWDGKFYESWSDNPAWVFYAVCSEYRIGLAEYLAGCDKWGLYSIGRYCDGIVQTGYRNGSFTYPEARFTCNLYVQAKEDAFKFLSDLSTCFRAAAYWNAGSVFVTQDSPQPTMTIFTEANVVSDSNRDAFAYAGTARRVRHTVAIVRFNDPEDGFKLKPVIVEDYAGILRYGRRPIEVNYFACASRGQARRFARWILQTELFNTDSCTHEVGLIGAVLRPGMIYGVLDPTRSAVQYAGRIMALELDDQGRSIITCDRRIPNENFDQSIPNNQYKFFCTRALELNSDVLKSQTEEEAKKAYTPQMTEELSVFAFGVDVLGRTTITLVSSLPDDVTVNAVWGLRNPKLNPQFFRCLGVAEVKTSQFEITGLEYHHQIFATIDNDAPYEEDPIRYDLDDWKRPGPPTDLMVVINSKIEQELQVYTMTVSWVPPRKGWVKHYNVYIQRSLGNYQFVTSTSNTLVDIRLPGVDNYCVRVVSVGITDIASEPAEVCRAVGVISGSNEEIISGLELVGQGNETEFYSATAAFDWRINWSGADSTLHTSAPGGPLPPTVTDYRVTIYDADFIPIISDLIVRTSYFEFTYGVLNKKTVTGNSTRGPFRDIIIDVTAHTNDGGFSAPARLRVRNEYPPAPLGPDVTVEGDENGQIIINYRGFVQPPDFAGIRVWQSETAGFIPTIDDIVYYGTSNVIVLAAEEMGKPYYFRIGVFDLLATDELDCLLSVEYSATGYKKARLSVFDMLRAN